MTPPAARDPFRCLDDAAAPAPPEPAPPPDADALADEYQAEQRARSRVYFDAVTWLDIPAPPPGPLRRFLVWLLFGFRWRAVTDSSPAAARV